MAQETEKNAGLKCSSCKAPDSARYRCRECVSASALCSTCIVSRHKFQPFHRIQVWTGAYFDAITLGDLGLVVCLGHGGSLCRASLRLKKMVIIHTNGVHHCSVRFCDCNDLTPNFQQLLLSRLFPATLTSPATAFTFDLLETFHQLTLCSKITPYDYFDTLRKLTNATFPQDVDVRDVNDINSLLMTIYRTDIGNSWLLCDYGAIWPSGAVQDKSMVLIVRFLTGAQTH